MGVTAIVMAGGKGTRMKVTEEKPLIQVGGKPVIAHVIESLLASKKVDSIIVAVTNNSPRTASFVSKFPVKIVKTPGKDYIFDMQYVVKKLELKDVMTVAADLPLITNEIIDNIAGDYERCGKPAMAVVVPMETKKGLGMGKEYAFNLEGKLVVPTGVNVIDGRKICEEELDQEFYISERKELAVNINTIKELELAERLIAEHA